MLRFAPTRASTHWKSLDPHSAIATDAGITAGPAADAADDDSARIETWDDLFLVMRKHYCPVKHGASHGRSSTDAG